MRKVRHKNVVQFIGACTRKPNLCIVFEFMSGGSVYDYIRRVRAAGYMCWVQLRQRTRDFMQLGNMGLLCSLARDIDAAV